MIHPAYVREVPAKPRRHDIAQPPVWASRWELDRMCNRLFRTQNALAIAGLCALFVPGAAFAAPPKSAGHSQTANSPSASQAKSDAIDPELKEALASAPKPSEWPNSNYARLLDMGNVTIKSDGTLVA